MKRVAISQSNYIPWKGYFDLIASVDEFIIYDDMQYTTRDWRNRNMIKTPAGSKWMSIPVGCDRNRRIRDVMLIDNGWNLDHWKMLQNNYARADHFKEIEEWLEPIYLLSDDVTLSTFNRKFIEHICSYLEIKTKISNSWDYSLVAGKTERLVDLCIQSKATKYISGPSAKNYIDKQIFDDADISLEWFDYSGYKEYPQLWGEFVHDVSILDLFFNCGKNSKNYMKFASL